MTVSFLEKDEYYQEAQRIGGGHWRDYKARWSYHGEAIKFARLVNIRSADRVLEMGTMGVNIVKGSQTIDYDKKWNYDKFSPTYLHDARKIPWPIADRQYDLFVALRVFHHLAPVQRECFAEAKRIARNIIIVCPETYDVKGYESSVGIVDEQFVAWNNGIEPTCVVNFESWIGNLYFWNEKAITASVPGKLYFIKSFFLRNKGKPV